jgi:hypothetical protein
MIFIIMLAQIFENYHLKIFLKSYNSVKDEFVELPIIDDHDVAVFKVLEELLVRLTHLSLDDSSGIVFDYQFLVHLKIAKIC